MAKQLCILKISAYNCIMKEISMQMVSEYHIDVTTIEQYEENRLVANSLRTSFKEHTDKLGEKIAATTISAKPFELNVPFI